MTNSPAKSRFAVGADHAGSRAKETIKKSLEGAGYCVDDAGGHSENSVDNPNRVLDGKVVSEDEAMAPEFLIAQSAGRRRIGKITEMDMVREHKS